MLPKKRFLTSITDLSPWEELLVELLATPSVTGFERDALLLLENKLRRYFRDATITRQPVAKDRWNIIIDKGHPTVTLTTHIDTVPGTATLSLSADSIAGRGACDAKGQIVAQLWGLHLAIERGLKDYRCAFVVGEETDAIGAREFLRLPTTPYILNGEPTSNAFVRRSWGGRDFEIRATGISAHSSLGTEHSAIHALIEDLAHLLQHQPDGVSINVGTITGGLASNIQAPTASCAICARARDGGEALEQRLAQQLRKTTLVPTCPSIAGLELFVPPFAGESNTEVRFASDCSVYATAYQHVMLFGPGHIKDAHTDTEKIDRAELREAAHTICRVLEELSPSSPSQEVGA